MNMNVDDLKAFTYTLLKIRPITKKPANGSLLSRKNSLKISKKDEESVNDNRHGTMYGETFHH